MADEELVTYRVHGYWLGPVITKWSTTTKSEFEDYCKKWGFKTNEIGGQLRSGADWIELREEPVEEEEP